MLSDEIASMHDYMSLEFLRFGDKFDYNISTIDFDNIDKWEVYPGMVQPFIENAIWHGVRGLEGRRGIINVVYKYLDPNHLQCLITDDGIGCKLSATHNKKFKGKKSRGIELVIQRLQIINDLKKSGLNLFIEDLYTDKEESGTRVIIDIPMRLKTP